MLNGMVMKDAKKKALSELIRKMRSMEASDLDEDLEEVGEKPDRSKRFGQGEMDKKVILGEADPMEEYADEDEEEPEDEGDIVNDVEDYNRERKTFMKGGARIAIKGPTKTMMLAIRSKPVMKKKM